ncbi:glycoside hydrolase family 16 protein [Actinoalloteichus hymeniacidonis]|uniref:Glycosyl hydrolase family 16 n=1 Tax=Actinoalloteichus hymeniacidonis TaxID=340345 RepID=A0AAC9HQ34_9PSEU|nr:glycoside hydrolase family 16 protein [Actinoalloteichus hymeniacidonis]AOS63424.1 glycosyl hydrolase family 16 [Actinoalloteichus hymeniacidonis]MBB5908534.1 beta-glucanase (GH16 family) [Actinoalloteichus hymeniacidonis]
MSRGRTGLALGAATVLLTALPVLPAGADTTPDSRDDAVVFFDDFAGSEIDRSQWTVEVTGTNFGTVNNEQQAYIDSPEVLYLDQNVDGADNVLAIHPRYRPGTVAPDGRTYDFVSGRLKTQDKRDWTYGNFAMRLKLPQGGQAPGLWPAAWMLGSSIGHGTPWPASGEIDIMESIGEPFTSVALHGPGYSGATPLNARQHFEGLDPADWHVYSVDWTPQGFTFYIDDRQVYTASRAEVEQYGQWVYDDPQFILLNFALGGDYPAGVNGVSQPYHGIPQSTVDIVAADNARYLIDWVKVEQN